MRRDSQGSLPHSEDRECEELRARGVRCDEPEVFPGFVTCCSFYDPFGNRLKMCSPAPHD